MHELLLLITMPEPVRAFVALAQAAGITVRQDAFRNQATEELISLHGTVSQFAALPEMARCRIPLRRGHWWMKLGIVGTMYRTGDDLQAVIEWTRSRERKTRTVRYGARSEAQPATRPGTHLRLVWSAPTGAC